MTFKRDLTSRMLDVICFYSKIFSESEKTFLETLQPGH